MTDRQHAPHHRRVVVTGMGALCALGNTVEPIWNAAVSGASGVAPITHFDAEGYETTIAGEVKGFEPDEAVGRKGSRRMDRYT
ncbi:MAG TPA: beta-ketoacyl synthase N-terminal-like domain-containing protein, partial [Thermomicrobiales bacterium]|nr:beta-ketoacyl synthase N-terminal-like domain-containing protein [Thermomicrobiales bacterium]